MVNGTFVVRSDGGKRMHSYTNFVIRHKKLIAAVFVLLAVLCAVLALRVQVNYNMVDYLPETAQSTKAVQIMQDSFSQAMPNANVMIRDVSLTQAASYKQTLMQIPGVEGVIWLDDTVDLKTPIETCDPDTVAGFYKDGNALYSVTIAEGQEVETIDAIRETFGQACAVSGEAADTASMRGATNTEVTNAVIILVPAIILLLVLSTSSWIEPLLFLVAIGVSIVISMGTNTLTGEISFVTNGVAPVLQLAVSLDYAIFLLHSFEAYRATEKTPEAAMGKAMQKSVKAIAASAVTTLFGFVALAFMKFGIGADLGLNLTKGIVLSFISCMVFLPALTLLCYRAIDKTRHRDFLPSFRNVYRVLRGVGVVVLILVVILVVPAYLGQQRVTFTYGNVETNPDSRNYQDNQSIQQEFGYNTAMAILVPNTDVAKELALSKDLQQVQNVTSVVSYALQVGTAIPSDFLDEAITGQFYAGEYARIILYLDTPAEGDAAFSTVEAVYDVVRGYYGDSFYAAGQSANLYDMKTVVQEDNVFVNLLAIVSIFAVLVVTFRSAVLPFLLLFTIEIGIWINLAIPYFTGTSLHFMGYLVISTVQLGATVDYAILLTSYYLDNRKIMPQLQAMTQAMGEAFKSILMSGTTLTIAGIALSITSSNPIVAELGALLAKGTVLSMLMVFCLLPILLRIFDRPVDLLTYRARFYRGGSTAKGA